MPHLRRILRDPALHFTVAGVAIFAVHQSIAPPEESEIIVSRALQDALRADFAKQQGREPSNEELTGAVDAWVNDEMLYRRGLDLELQRGDPVLRRRLVQAMQFILEEGIGEPTDADLKRLLDESPEEFATPSRVDFEHIFFGREARGAASQALQTLQAEPDRPQEISGARPFIHGRSLVGQSAAQLDTTFGPGFALKLAQLPNGTWGGPVTSSYGLHVVRILSKTETTRPTVEEARSQLVARWKQRARKQRVTKELEKLREHYEVVVQ